MINYTSPLLCDGIAWHSSIMKNTADDLPLFGISESLLPGESRLSGRFLSPVEMTGRFPGRETESREPVKRKSTHSSCGHIRAQVSFLPKMEKCGI